MALKDDLLQKALARSPHRKPVKSSYSHFKIYEKPPEYLEKLDTNQTQTEHSISRHKPDTNQTQNKTQTEYKVVTKQIQSGYNFEHKPNTNQTQTRHEVDTKLTPKITIEKHKPTTNQTQTRHNSPLIELEKINFSTFVGVQKNILVLFYFECKKNRSKETSELTVECIATRLNIPLGSIKTSVRRLENKGVVKRTKFKNGRGGWSKYELNDGLYHEMMKCETEHKLNTNLTQIEHKDLNKLNTNESEIVLHNSSSNNINTTTNINRGGDLPEEWRNIDFQPLEHIGFSQTQLKQLHTINTNTPQVIQESIYQFAFGLENNPKVQSYNDPLNVFMGLLRKGGSWVEKDYISPKVKAEREMLAAMEKELAELKEIEEKKFETAFSIWHLKLSNSDKENILLNYPKIEEGSKFSEMAKMGNLKKYFKEEVYSKS